MAPIGYATVQGSTHDERFSTIAQHMFALMVRNIASDGFVFQDPATGSFSRPGAVLASPSYPQNLAIIDQNYVYNWTRDAALTAMEVAAAALPEGVVGNQTLTDYVMFARTCQQQSAPIERGCYRIDGTPRDWSDQSDGPALRILATLRALPVLDGEALATAAEVIGADLQFLLGAYKNPTVNLWEEHRGHSFFTRAVQLRCFTEVVSTPYAQHLTDDVAAAVEWLTGALEQHWDGTRYLSILDGDAGSSLGDGYDPNIDIVMASVYGAVPVTDLRLLATAAELRDVWADLASPSAFPVNAADRAAGRGPMFGRYPSDHYDGDTQDPDVVGQHPWPLCTANVAELYYRLAAAIKAAGVVAVDPPAERFFAQVGVTAASTQAEAVSALRAAGDSLLDAVVFHSDHLELSEQFDGATGYEKSVRNLTWSYGAFLSAVRARDGATVTY